jgi:subtilisin family serine protease
MKKIVLSLLLLFAVSAEAKAADYPIIIETKLLAPVNLVVNLLGGKLLDHIPGTNTYLLKVPVLPSLLPNLSLKLLGLISIELDKTIVEPASVRWGVMTVDNADVDWYKAQPQLQRVRAPAALGISQGAGVVVADLNSRTDFGHPALAGHLTGGYDFVGARVGYQGTLNQSSATFLDQSSATFLDQSSATFLDQSSATFLDQSSATFLDNQAIALVDGGNPAYSHGTLVAGVIAAVAPESRVMPLRVFDDTGRADVFSVAKAIHYAVDNGAKVINLSFGMSQSYNAIKRALAYECAGCGVGG